MKVFVEQEFIYKVHLGGAKFWGDFMVFLSAVVHLQISLLCSKGCNLWLMAFSYVLMPMHFEVVFEQEFFLALSGWSFVMNSVFMWSSFRAQKAR
jgi:hypothetical protein